MFCIYIFVCDNYFWGKKYKIIIKHKSLFPRYVGEIISEEEADMRKNDTYLFSMDNKVHTDDLRVIYNLLEPITFIF